MNKFDILGLIAPAIPIAIGGISAATALKMAAAAAGVSIFACLMMEPCRDEAARLACIAACDAAHDLQSIACKLRIGKAAQRRCLEQAFEDYADCIRHCNRR